MLRRCDEDAWTSTPSVDKLAKEALCQFVYTLRTWSTFLFNVLWKRGQLVVEIVKERVQSIILDREICRSRHDWRGKRGGGG